MELGVTVRQRVMLRELLVISRSLKDALAVVGSQVVTGLALPFSFTVALCLKSIALDFRRLLTLSTTSAVQSMGTLLFMAANASLAAVLTVSDHAPHTSTS
eukprot:scaffold638638_cov45-Prasinocladus_malaysianus.AAC.1